MYLHTKLLDVVEDNLFDEIIYENRFLYLIVEMGLYMKKIIFMMIYDVIGSVFIGVSIVCFAVAADFAPGGVNGIAVMANYLANIPIGLATILINIPIILFTFRSLGKAFFLYSVKTMVISSFLIDYVLCRLPLYHGSRLLAAILAGITAGIGYSLIFNEGSSTGGTDFIIAAIKKKKPKMTFGLLAFAVDGIIVWLNRYIGDLLIYSTLIMSI